MPEVYDYLVSRCGSAATAQNLTFETFLAAVGAVGCGAVREPAVAWLIGVARHKLVGHCRRIERREHHVEPPRHRR